MLAIAVAVFAPMVRTVAGLFTELSAPVLNFRVVIVEVPFSLVLVEVVRLLVIYLQEHRVAIEFMVELGIWPRSRRSRSGVSSNWTGST